MPAFIFISETCFKHLCIPDVEYIACKQCLDKKAVPFFGADLTVMTGLSAAIRCRGVRSFPRTADLT